MPSSRPNRISKPLIIGRSPAMQRLWEAIRRTARVDHPVLIQGPTGTGKELVARAIHCESDRADGPFLVVNCGAVSETLVMSEFFGHVRGAFSSADRDRVGHFLAANEGTIFLDEVVGMSMPVQMALLRVLQAKEVMRVGESFVRQTTARVIAAANRDLATCVREGTLREDLFYRLRGLCIDVPALTERREDIPLLVEHFLRVYGERGKPTTVSEEAMQALVAHDWEGNVRDVEMLARNLVVAAPGREIGLRDLPSYIPRPPGESLVGVRPLSAVRQDYFLRTVRTLLHVGRAAKVLGVSERTVQRVLADVKARAMEDVGRMIPERDMLAAYVAEVIKLAHGNRTEAAQALGIAFATLVKYERRARETGLKWRDLCQTLSLPNWLNSSIVGSATESHALRAPSSEDGGDHDRI